MIKLKAQLQEKVDDALVKLQDALADGDSETLKAYLAFISKFHNYSYSFGNLILIYLQNPHASHVAGFHNWKALPGNSFPRRELLPTR